MDGNKDIKTTLTQNPDNTHTVDSSVQESLPFWRRVWLMYYEGFRNMTVGKTLWLVILIKLFLMFVIIKWIFFPDFLGSRYDNDADKAVAVRENLTRPNQQLKFD